MWFWFFRTLHWHSPSILSRQVVPLLWLSAQVGLTDPLGSIRFTYIEAQGRGKNPRVGSEGPDATPRSFSYIALQGWVIHLIGLSSGFKICLLGQFGEYIKQYLHKKFFLWVKSPEFKDSVCFIHGFFLSRVPDTENRSSEILLIWISEWTIIILI